MAGESAKASDNADAARKRPLDGKENNHVGISHDNDAANNDNKKSRSGYGSSDNDDIEVLSPPPKPVSASAASHHHQQQQQAQASNSGTGANSDNDECVVEWSNATNPNVNLPHLRPNCGVHHFATDPLLFCAKCYCVTCDKLVSECDDWDTHCNAREAERKKPQDGDVIDVDDDSPAAANPYAFHNNPAVQSYYGRNAAALMMNQRLHNNNNNMDGSSEEDENDDYDNRMHGMMRGNIRSPFDSHFTKAYNEKYDNENKKERGRNPKDMRIPEILADKLMNALVLAEEASSKAYQKENNNDASGAFDKPTKGKSKDDKKDATANNKSAMELFSSQDLQRKERYERSQMEGDVPQLGLHASFFVEGVRIGWPYPSILKPQRQMAIHLIKALKNSRHVVLESPTVRL